jgi:hypothetical protein
MSASNLLASGTVSITGDQALAEEALHFCENRVLF